MYSMLVIKVTNDNTYNFLLYRGNTELNYTKSDNQLMNFNQDNKDAEKDGKLGRTFVLGIVENHILSVPSIFQGL
jgi:hypothetical protein